MSGIRTPDQGRHPLNQFQDDVAVAKMAGPQEGDALPIVETTREVIDFYMKGNPQAFDKAGYFIFQDVLVCEKGKMPEVRASFKKSTEDYLFAKHT